MKKPPDVYYVNLLVENPLYKWVMLSNWAIEHNDAYLKERAYQMIIKLKNQ